jgi:hypothetical protein
VAVAPNPRQKRDVGITGHPKVEQIADRLIGSVQRNISLPHETRQNLRDFKVDKVRRMQRFVV